MYDLSVPADSYQREIERLRGLAQSTGMDNSYTGSSSAAKGRKEIERYNTLIDKLLVCTMKNSQFFLCFDLTKL